MQKHIVHRVSPSDAPALFILAFHTGGFGLVSDTEECMKRKLRSQQNSLEIEGHTLLFKAVLQARVW